MADNNPARRFFYKNSNAAATALPHAIVSGAAILALVIATLITKSEYILTAGTLLLVYAYVSMGRAGGNLIGAFVMFVILIAMIALGKVPQYSVLLAVTAACMAYLNIQLGYIDEKDSVYTNWEGVLKESTIEYVEKINKLKGVIDSNKERIVRYRLLNEIAQKLTSALEKKQIVDVIAEALVKIIRKEGVQFVLLIHDQATGTFVPASEEKSNTTLVKGTIKLYKKDPFDEWVEKNKQTLIIKNLEDDFRFKTMIKDSFVFRLFV